MCDWSLLGNDESFVCKNSSPPQISGLCKHRQSSRDLPRRESELWAEAERTASTRLECYVPPSPLTLNSTLHHIHRLPSSPRVRCRSPCFSFSFFRSLVCVSGRRHCFFHTRAYLQRKSGCYGPKLGYVDKLRNSASRRPSVCCARKRFIYFILLLLIITIILRTSGPRRRYAVCEYRVFLSGSVCNRSFQ